MDYGKHLVGVAATKEAEWQHSGESVLAVARWRTWLWRQIADTLKQPSQAAEEHQNNQQGDHAARTGVAQLDLDWKISVSYS